MFDYRRVPYCLGMDIQDYSTKYWQSLTQPIPPQNQLYTVAGGFKHVSLNLIIHHHSAFFFLGCSNLLWVTFKATSGVHGSSMVIAALDLPNFHQFPPPTLYVQLFSHSFSFWCLVGLVGTGNGMIVRRCYNIYQHNILFHIDICQRLVNNFLHRSKWLCLKIGYIPNEIAIFFGFPDQQNHWVKRGTLSLLNGYFPY